MLDNLNPGAILQGLTLNFESEQIVSCWGFLLFCIPHSILLISTFSRYIWCRGNSSVWKRGMHDTKTVALYTFVYNRFVDGGEPRFKFSCPAHNWMYLWSPLHLTPALICWLYQLKSATISYTVLQFLPVFMGELKANLYVAKLL